MLTRLLYFLFLCLLPASLYAQAPRSELFEQHKTAETPLEKVNTLALIAESYLYQDTDSALFYAEKVWQLANSYGQDSLRHYAYYQVGWAHLQKGNTTKAALYLDSAIHLFVENMDSTYLAKNYSLLANCYASAGTDYEKAIELYQKAMGILENLNSIEGVASISNNLAYLFDKLGDRARAKEYYLIAYEKVKELDNPIGRLYTALNVAAIYDEENKLDSADYFLTMSYELAKSTQRVALQANASSKLALLRAKQGSTNAALKFAKESIELSEASGVVANLFQGYMAQGEVYEKMKMYALASESYESAYTIADTTKNLPSLKGVLAHLASVNAELGRAKEAYSYLKQFISVKDTLAARENSKKAQELQTKYDFTKKEQEITFLNEQAKLQDKLISQQQWFIIASLTGLLITLLILFQLFRINKQKRKAFTLLEQNTKEIEVKNSEIIAQRDNIQAQNKELEVKNEEIQEKANLLLKQKTFITDSIRYAKEIQFAMLPDGEFLEQHFADYFIFFHPRDLVSGDFFWVRQAHGKIAVAVADCTGHGVPGALMSMLGMSFLTETFENEAITEGKEILSRLHNRIFKALRQDKEQNTDGMDVCLCIFDLASLTEPTKKLEFTGAKRPLYYWDPESQELKEIKGTRKSIGGFLSKSHPFETQTLELKAESKLYLSSDGFADQLNPERKKFSTRRLKNLLTSLNEENTPEKTLEETLLAHRESVPQIDDILILGLRL